MPSREPLGEVRSPANERQILLTIPNVLTVLRLAAIVPFFWLTMQGRDREALTLFLIAGLTDTLDGTIARRFGQVSKIGRLFDPLADKLFTGAAYVGLSLFRAGFPSIPKWVMVAVVLRDVLILSGSILVFRMSRDSGFKPSVYGKLNTFIEIGVVVLFLAQPDLPFLRTILPFTYVLLLASLLVSAGDYVKVGLRMIKAPA